MASILQSRAGAPAATLISIAHRHVASRHSQPALSLAKAQRRTLVYLPVVLQPAFWKGMVPSFLRRSRSEDSVPISRRPWNPATFYIWMFLFIGSQAIQTITLRSGFEKFSYETEQKLQLLREVVNRVKAGEDVDVRKELGTGEPKKEKEWEEGELVFAALENVL